MLAHKSHQPIKLVLGFILLGWTLLPIYWLLSLAIREQQELLKMPAFFSKTFSLENFQVLFAQKHFLLPVINSLEIAFISLAISLAAGICCAYVLARARFQFHMKGFMLLGVILVRILPPIAFALPLYIMMNHLGWLSSKVPLVLSHVLLNVPLIIWFMINFFNSLPVEIEESAAVDGAGEWQVFYRIVLPQVLPGIAAIGILSFMVSWNEYLYGAIFIQSPGQFTIPLALSTLNSEQELAQWGNIAAGGIISLLPIAAFVIMAQNFLLAGFSNGSSKQ